MIPLEGLGPLLPEHISEFVVGIALFALIWFVVAKKIVPMFEDTYAKRAEAITGGMERAEIAQKEAQTALEEYKAQLASAREEAAKIRDEARAQAAQIAAEIKQQAADEAARLVESAKTQIEAERSLAVRSLRGEIGGLATELAGKIVGESLADDAAAQRTVDRFLAELESEKV
ncbi:MAG: F0F1 ATP synthase subunit B [Propionibacteriaceae bacterium]|jgi:F-type H+-transporting ATPase subunit b|nr:F0F1 ATP synthase subunit B [Propionibacteriaceae bacterium]